MNKKIEDKNDSEETTDYHYTDEEIEYFTNYSKDRDIDEIPEKRVLTSKQEDERMNFSEKIMEVFDIDY